MPRKKTATTDVISEFVSYYLENVFAGRCRDNQYGLAFMLAKGGYMFVSVDPDPRVDSDPTALAPREMFPVVAHAVFKPRLGRVRFSTPSTGDGLAPTAYEIDDPVLIHFEQHDQAELWILSMSTPKHPGSAIQVHRADPATLRHQDRAGNGNAPHSLH